ncbi:MAG TPA: gamma-glutamyl-phosphate reductase, partial [Campylobacterales bacterium]|nr:gamma-glutamyl-phosphate reductase [Campylobacterales bacterium]
MQDYLQRAKDARIQLSQTTGKLRNDVLSKMAKALRAEHGFILEANAKDMEYAKSAGLSSAMLDRLLLDEKRINAMAE